MDNVVIFYFPFHEDTYVPITVESIEEKAICKFTLAHSSDEVRVLQRAIEAAQAGAFDNSAVRLKAVGLLGDTIYMDVDGGVLHQRSNWQSKLAETDFNAVKSSMAKLAKEQGCE